MRGMIEVICSKERHTVSATHRMPCVNLKASVAHHFLHLLLQRHSKSLVAVFRHCASNMYAVRWRS
jgi:hypothetical protein